MECVPGDWLSGRSTGCGLQSAETGGGMVKASLASRKTEGRSKSSRDSWPRSHFAQPAEIIDAREERGAFRMKFDTREKWSGRTDSVSRSLYGGNGRTEADAGASAARREPRPPGQNLPPKKFVAFGEAPPCAAAPLVAGKDNATDGPARKAPLGFLKTDLLYLTELRARRKPRSWLRWPGANALRYADRHLTGSLNQQPPRSTRTEPSNEGGPTGSIAVLLEN